MSGTVDGTEELVTQIAVAMLYIDKVKPGSLCQLSCPDKVFYQTGNVLVSHHRRVAGHPKSLVKNGMMVENSGFGASPIKRTINSSRMSQLQPDQQVVTITEILFMGSHQQFSQFANLVHSLFGYH